MNLFTKLRSLYKEPTYLVAVYGSLRKELGNHILLETSEYITTGLTVSSKFAMISLGGYPMTLANRSNFARQVVEIYRVNKKTLARLDQLEGHPSFYCREKVDITTESSETVTCWMYIGSQDYVDRFKLSTSTVVPRMYPNAQDWKVYYQAKQAGTLKVTGV